MMGNKIAAASIGAIANARSGVAINPNPMKPPFDNPRQTTATLATK